jgi:hypothetical protein
LGPKGKPNVALYEVFILRVFKEMEPGQPVTLYGNHTTPQ